MSGEAPPRSTSPVGRGSGRAWTGRGPLATGRRWRAGSGRDHSAEAIAAATVRGCDGGVALLEGRRTAATLRSADWCRIWPAGGARSAGSASGRCDRSLGKTTVPMSRLPSQPCVAAWSLLRTNGGTDASGPRSTRPIDDRRADGVGSRRRRLRRGSRRSRAGPIGAPLRGFVASGRRARFAGQHGPIHSVGVTCDSRALATGAISALPRPEGRHRDHHRSCGVLAGGSNAGRRPLVLPLKLQATPPESRISSYSSSPWASARGRPCPTCAPRRW